MTIDHERTTPDHDHDDDNDGVVDTEDLDRDDDVETTEDFGENPDVETTEDLDSEDVDSSYADADEDVDETGVVDTDTDDDDTDTVDDDDGDTDTVDSFGTDDDTDTVEGFDTDDDVVDGLDTDTDDDTDTVEGFETGTDTDTDTDDVNEVDAYGTTETDTFAEPEAEPTEGYFERSDAVDEVDEAEVPDEVLPVAAEAAPAAFDGEAPFLTNAAAFQERWDGVQIGFVDEPRDAVENAGDLVAEVVDELAAALAARRSELEGQWRDTADVSTEDLRVVFQAYRAFFRRLVL